MLGFSSTSNLGKYLGFLLKHLGATSQDFNFVIERVQNKLQGWKSKLLSMAGRVVLSQAVISATPAYVVQGCILSQRVLSSIDKTNRNFVWGSIDGKWNLGTLSFYFPPSLLRNILSTPLHRFAAWED